MGWYIARRLLFLVPLLVVVSLVTFAALVLLPGDPLDQLVLADPSLTQVEIAQMREVYGVDDPLGVQYGKWLGQMLQGNLGFSRTYRAPVVDIVVPATLNTLILGGLSLGLTLLISIPVGIFSAVRPYSTGDHIATMFSFVGFAVPRFWLGLMLIILFAVQLDWLPAGGILTPGLSGDTIAVIIDRIRHLVLPVLVLSLSTMALWSRYMRSSLLEVVAQDYIQTARAKGLSRRTVVGRHAMRNALIPMVTLFAVTVQSLASGAVVVEQVFSYPGLGKMLYDSVLTNDHAVTMAVLLILMLVVVGFNLIADVMYGVVDPRVRYE